MLRQQSQSLGGDKRTVKQESAGTHAPRAKEYACPCLAPTGIGRAPNSIAARKAEPMLCRHAPGVQRSSCVDNTFGIAGRPGCIVHERWVLGGNVLRLEA